MAWSVSQHSVGDGGDVVPLEKGADDGVIAMKKDEIGKNALLLVAVRLLQMFDVVRASAFVHLLYQSGLRQRRSAVTPRARGRAGKCRARRVG